MLRRIPLYNWIRAATQGQPGLRPGAGDRGRPAARYRDRGVSDRIPADLRGDIVRGRAALADTTTPPRHDALGHGDSRVMRLLTLLWHEEEEVRRAAAHALPGGDHHYAHIPHYGHFVGAFLRGLTESRTGNYGAKSPGENSNDPQKRSPAHIETTRPATDAARHARVVVTLRAMLDQSIGEIRGMSNMNYSFLSSALYLAVLATCRDVLYTMRRLRAESAQAELCSLLWNLSQLSVLRCLNGQDLETLGSAAGEALSALPPDRMPDFWYSLAHEQQPRRLAVVPALRYFHDRGAVPYLLDALAGQPTEIAVPIITCLTRMEDARALPALQTLTRSRDRQLRAAALAAVSAIQRAGHKQPSRTLLRAIEEPDTHDSETMLRSAPVNHHNMEPPRELLRTAPSAPPGAVGSNAFNVSEPVSAQESPSDTTLPEPRIPVSEACRHE